MKLVKIERKKEERCLGVFETDRSRWRSIEQTKHEESKVDQNNLISFVC
jgi:hypothetical protein